jgi:hypothetical protein
MGITCKANADGEGSCKAASTAKIEVCGGVCREYYPQIRYFIKDLLKDYPKLTVSTSEDQTGEQPFIEFFDASNNSMEKVEVGGMFTSEMEEELNARGILRSKN